MKTITLFIPALLLIAGASSAQVDKDALRAGLGDSAAGKAALSKAASGPAFRVGDRQYRLAPDGVVGAANAKRAADGNEVRVGKYSVRFPSAAGGAAKSAGAGGTQRLAAAIGQTGEPVVVTSTLDVYVASAAVLQDAVRASGGKLVYSSAVGGNGKIEFASVNDALAALGKIEGLAGVKEVSPALVPPENSLY